MNKFKELINKHFSTFRSKLTAAFILTSMIPLLLSITIAMFIINSYLRKETINQLLSDASLEAQQIEARLGQIIDMQNALSSLFSSSLTPDNASKDISSLALSRFESLRANVTSLEYVYNVKKIRIYSDYFPFTNGDSFHFFPLTDLDSSVLRQIASESSGVNRLKAFSSAGTSTGSTASFYKAIKNISGTVIAVYFIDIDLPNTMKSILSPTTDTTALSLLDSKSGLLYSSTQDLLLPDPPDSYETNKVFSSENSRFRILKKSSYTDWYYLFESSKGSSKIVNQALLTGYLLVFSLTVLLCIIAVIIFPITLSKRIKYFSNTINNIPDEDLASSSAAGAILDTLVKDSTTGDEIDSIITTFSNLFKKNTQLNTAIRQHELEIEKSKFTILQEQINPHFLYNSLDTIRICMLMDKKETACRLIQSLSQFYRIPLSKGKDIITIDQELRMIEAYLQIEQAGYDGKITWQISCSDRVSAFGIPKFTLQPIVENSIIHGDFISSPVPLSITITVEYTELLKITLKDNGPGIPPDRLTELNHLLASQTLVPTAGYGLQNCCQRIRLHYGPAYGIQITSTPKGTQTTLTLPKILP